MHWPCIITILPQMHHLYLPPATKLGQGYVFTCVCDSVHRGKVLSQHALQVVSQHALQVSRGCVLSQHALQVVSQHALQQVSRGVPALGGSALRGVPGGDPPGRLLLRAVRIPLECILVGSCGYKEP